MTYSFDTLVQNMNGLLDSQHHQNDADTSKVNAKAGMLEQFKLAELEGKNFHKVKEEAYQNFGYSQKVYNETSNTFIKEEGESAPDTIQTAYSEAKRAYLKFESFKDFTTWEDMKKACKKEDDQADAKAIFREIMKEAKKLDNSWNTYIEGALTKLQEEVSKAQTK